jgi:restriction endonuclease Mrr
MGASTRWRRRGTLMMDYDVGVNTSATYSVKRVDSDYFDETGGV